MEKLAFGQWLSFDAHCPLGAKDSPLDKGQKSKAQCHGSRKPDQKLQRDGRTEILLHGQRTRHHDMADKEDREIGRGIIAAIFTDRVAADIAFRAKLQITAECKAMTAIGAFPSETAAKPGQKPVAALIVCKLICFGRNIVWGIHGQN
jgi:hypothetical protein